MILVILMRINILFKNGQTDSEEILKKIDLVLVKVQTYFCSKTFHVKQIPVKKRCLLFVSASFIASKMLRKISTVKDIRSLKKGDLVWDAPDVFLGKKYVVYKVLVDDLILHFSDGQVETKFLTSKEILAGNWWIR